MIKKILMITSSILATIGILFFITAWYASSIEELSYLKKYFELVAVPCAVLSGVISTCHYLMVRNSK